MDEEGGNAYNRSLANGACASPLDRGVRRLRSTRIKDEKWNANNVDECPAQMCAISTAVTSGARSTPSIVNVAALGVAT